MAIYINTILKTVDEGNSYLVVSSPLAGIPSRQDRERILGVHDSLQKATDAAQHFVAADATHCCRIIAMREVNVFFPGIDPAL